MFDFQKMDNMSNIWNMVDFDLPDRALDITFLAHLYSQIVFGYMDSHTV